MKAFVTGGTGFVGQHVVKKLLARGYEVMALARSPLSESARRLTAMGAQIAAGDMLDVDSMREPMAGCDVVFHVAGWYKIGDPNPAQAEIINVSGTRKVLRLAYELGIPKIIYTSTVAVFGDTKGKLVDETFYQGGPFATEYDRTKWLAHYKVALPLIEKGAPIIIVMPGGVYGSGDTGPIADMMRLFYRGIPVLPGPETTVTYAHVEDIAEGHVLAAEKGRIGESYVLAGPAIPLSEMVEFWGYLTGKQTPQLHIPASLLRPAAPLVGAIASQITLPSVFSQEATGALGVTYMARSDKARRELGWQTRPLQTGMLETFAWVAETEATRPGDSEMEKQLASAALLAAVVLLLLWVLERRRRRGR
jgi:dihydroflavonol-4-reductase